MKHAQVWTRTSSVHSGPTGPAGGLECDGPSHHCRCCLRSLEPKARARVEELLRQHPDFKTLPAREGFLTASTWPDTIRNDNRFYDDTRADAKPTAVLPEFLSMGFPRLVPATMARHTNWHYVDIPFSPDGTPLEATPTPNALV